MTERDLEAVELDRLDAWWDELPRGESDGAGDPDHDLQMVVRALHARQAVTGSAARRVWLRAHRVTSEVQPEITVFSSGTPRGGGRSPGLLPGKQVWPVFELVAAVLVLVVLGGVMSGGSGVPGVGRLGPGTASAEAAMLPATAGPMATPSGFRAGVIAIVDPAASAEPDRLLALDPVTLDDAPAAAQPARPDLTGRVLLSADGTTRVEMSRSPDLLAGGDPDAPTSISVRDAATGYERQAITVPVALSGGMLNADGTRLIGFAAGMEDRPQTWFVLPLTADVGPELPYVAADSVGDPPFALDDAFLIDADARYLYRLVTLGTRDDPAPRATQLVVAELTTGREIARVDLPGVVAGPYRRGTEPEAPWVNLRPALALSPGGMRLAIVHADREAVSTFAIGTDGSVALAKTTELQRSVGISRDFTGEGAYLFAAFGTDGETLYVFGRFLIPVPGDVREFPIGIRRIDLARAEIVTEALTDRLVVQGFATDDGVYVAGAPQRLDADGTPIIAWEEYRIARLDGETLAVEAERTFPEAEAVGLIVLGGTDG